MGREIDVRGIACPGPVIETKKALEALVVGVIEVVVDNPISAANVEKLAQGLGYPVSMEAKEGLYRLSITKGEPQEEDREVKEKDNLELALFIGNHVIGNGDETLGKLLLKNFLYTLTESQSKPKKILLMNSGVKIAIEGAEALGNLQTLESQGAEVLVCGTCLDYYQIKEQLRVGKISNMYDIGDAMLKAEKLISFT